MEPSISPRGDRARELRPRGKRALDAGDVGRQLVLAMLELLLQLRQLGGSLLEDFGLGGQFGLALFEGLRLVGCPALELGGLDGAPLEGLLLGGGQLLGPLDSGLALIECLLAILQALVGSALELLRARLDAALPHRQVRSRSVRSRPAWRSSCSRASRVSRRRLSSASRASCSLRNVCSRSATRIRSVSSCSVIRSSRSPASVLPWRARPRAPRFEPVPSRARRCGARASQRARRPGSRPPLRADCVLRGRAGPPPARRDARRRARRRCRRCCGRRRTRGGCGSWACAAGFASPHRPRRPGLYPSV